MIPFDQSLRIVVASKPVNFRKGYGGLTAVGSCCATGHQRLPRHSAAASARPPTG